MLDDYIKRFARDGSAEHFFFACHIPNGMLCLPEGLTRHHLWSGTALADAAISAGLFNWLIDCTR